MNTFVAASFWILGLVASASADIREPDQNLDPKQQIMWDESEQFAPLGIDVVVVRFSATKRGLFFHDAVYWRKHGNGRYSPLGSTPAGLNWLLERIGPVIDAPPKRAAFAQLVATALCSGSCIDADDYSRILGSHGYLPDKELLKGLAALPGGKTSLSFASRGVDEFTFWRFDIQFDTPTHISGLTVSEIKPTPGNKPSEQAGADQPATAPESKSEGKQKPQPESKPAPR